MGLPAHHLAPFLLELLGWLGLVVYAIYERLKRRKTANLSLAVAGLLTLELIWARLRLHYLTSPFTLLKWSGGDPVVMFLILYLVLKHTQAHYGFSRALKLGQTTALIFTGVSVLMFILMLYLNRPIFITTLNMIILGPVLVMLIFILFRHYFVHRGRKIEELGQ